MRTLHLLTSFIAYFCYHYEHNRKQLEQYVQFESNKREAFDCECSGGGSSLCERTDDFHLSEEGDLQGHALYSVRSDSFC